MSLQYIFFDLDGTLLPMDQDLFVGTFSGMLTEKMVKDRTNMQKGNPLKSTTLSASKRALKKKAIAREFEMKRRELGLGVSGMKRGIGFYLVLIVGMILIGSIVMKQAGETDKFSSITLTEMTFHNYALLYD